MVKRIGANDLRQSFLQRATYEGQLTLPNADTFDSSLGNLTRERLNLIFNLRVTFAEVLFF